MTSWVPFSSETLGQPSLPQDPGLLFSGYQGSHASRLLHVSHHDDSDHLPDFQRGFLPPCFIPASYLTCSGAVHVHYALPQCCNEKSWNICFFPEHNEFVRASAVVLCAKWPSVYSFYAYSPAWLLSFLHYYEVLLHPRATCLPRPHTPVSAERAETHLLGHQSLTVFKYVLAPLCVRSFLEY